MQHIGEEARCTLASLNVYPSRHEYAIVGLGDIKH